MIVTSESKSNRWKKPETIGCYYKRKIKVITAAVYRKVKGWRMDMVGAQTFRYSIYSFSKLIN